MTPAMTWLEERLSSPNSAMTFSTSRVGSSGKQSTGLFSDPPHPLMYIWGIASSEHPSWSRGLFDPKSVGLDERVGGFGELSHERDDGNPGGCSGLPQRGVFCFVVRIGPHRREGGHAERVAQGGPATADARRARPLAGVAGVRGNAGEAADPFSRPSCRVRAGRSGSRRRPPGRGRGPAAGSRAPRAMASSSAMRFAISASGSLICRATSAGRVLVWRLRTRLLRARPRSRKRVRSGAGPVRATCTSLRSREASETGRSGSGASAAPIRARTRAIRGVGPGPRAAGLGEAPGLTFVRA